MCEIIKACDYGQWWNSYIYEYAEKFGINVINKSASTWGFYHSLLFLALFFILLFCIFHIKWSKTFVDMHTITQWVTPINIYLSIRDNMVLFASYYIII